MFVTFNKKYTQPGLYGHTITIIICIKMCIKEKIPQKEFARKLFVMFKILDKALRTYRIYNNALFSPISV